MKYFIIFIIFNSFCFGNLNKFISKQTEIRESGNKDEWILYTRNLHGNNKKLIYIKKNYKGEYNIYKKDIHGNKKKIGTIK